MNRESWAATARSKKLRGVLALSFTLACGWYLFGQVRASWSEFRGLDWGLSTVAALLAAAAVHLGMLLLEAWYWAKLLREIGVPAGNRRALAIFGVSQFAKYLPGNVAQHVGRLALAREAGWQTGRVALTLALEVGFALGSAAVIAVTSGLTPLLGNALGAAGLTTATVATLIAWVVGTFALKLVLARPPARVRRFLGLAADDGPRGLNLSARFLAEYFLVQLASYAALGFSFVLLLRAMSGQMPAQTYLLPAVVTLSWLAGFLVPGAPAGLGVREAALSAMLAPTLGAGLVLSAAALWRLAHILSDALLFALGLALQRRLAGAPKREFPAEDPPKTNPPPG